MSFFRRALTGIDLGNNVVKIALCKYRAGKPVVIKAIKFDLPSDYQINDDLDFCIESVRRVCNSSKIPLNNTAIVADHEWYKNVIITFPEMPKKELEQAILYEIKRQSNLNLENISYDYYPNRVVGKDREYYIFYSEKPKIKEIVNKFRKHNINLKIIDVKEMVSLALYKNLYADDKTVKCFFDFGYLSSKIIFTKGERLIFVRTTGYGVKSIYDILKNNSTETNLTEVFEFKGINDGKIEELLKDYFSEIFYDTIRTINFFSTTYKESSPSNIIYSGGIFAIPGIHEYFCQNLPYTCILNNVLDLLDYKDEDIRKKGFMFNYAVGVALR
ncbi:MAG: pilus assembly protein PilM [Proteobacteria bacterium]|nr:pilus assembly protein PilM [Pseudomonadota bacterium]